MHSCDCRALFSAQKLYRTLRSACGTEMMIKLVILYIEDEGAEMMNLEQLEKDLAVPDSQNGVLTG